MNITSTLAMFATALLLMADATPVNAEAPANADPQLVFVLVFGVMAAMLAVLFGLWVADESTKLRQLKKRQKDIEERYRAVREDMLREMDRRHRAEQTLLATTGRIAAAPNTGALISAYTTSSAFPPNTNPLSPATATAATTRLGEITISVTDNTDRRSTTTPPDQNHFARIGQPRRFLRLD